MFTNVFGNEKNVCCGLVQLIEKESELDEPPTKFPIPLISVDVNASIVHAVAQVEVTQVYVNKEEQPIEAIYFFPLNPDGAVTHFQAELEGCVIKGIVKAHEEAKEEYEKAIENKTTALLGEETKADIFKVRVGYLKPGSQVKVIIGYVTEVKNEPGTNAIRFYIPTTVAPRYVSPSEKDEKAEDIRKMTYSDTSPAPLTLKVAVSLQDDIKSIESPTHSIKVEKQGPVPGKQSWQKALVELSGTTTDMDRDFVLNILPEQIHKPRLYSEKMADGSTAAMLHLIPSFKLDEIKTELIFVLDRSGSMMGQSIELAKNALLLFLHSIPADCYFNIIGFGSSYHFLFPKSVKYDDRTLKTAIKHAKNLEADLGGTEILKPLKEIFGQSQIKGYLRQIFVLTDGEVSNTEEVLGVTQAHAHKARVFALGIGDGASHHLVEGLAKAGGGTSAFVTYNESVDKKVLNQLKNGLQPCLIDIELQWEGIQTAPAVEKSTVVINKVKTLLGYNKPLESVSQSTTGNKQSPKRIPPVYDGSQLLVFGLFNSECPSSVVMKALSPDGPLTITVEHSTENDVGTTGMLHRLAAVKLVRDLELEISGLHFQGLDDVSGLEESKKKEIIEIACKYGVTSKYTSFVAVDVKDEKPSMENWSMETRYVPSQFSHGWHGGFDSGHGQFMQSYSMACSFSKRSVGSIKSTGLRRYSLNMKKSEVNEVDRRMSTTPVRLACKLSAGRRFSCKEEMSSDSSMDDDDEDDDPVPETMRKSCTTKLTMQKLISLQSFDGSYLLDEKLSDIVDVSLKKLKEDDKKHGLPDKVFATALAIAYFMNKLHSEKDMWELIVLKARKWLAKNLSDAGQVDNVISMAASSF
ncbi:unnamed protein product [Orchesella dallaii]|uniref:von Willebrand factor A domain-containing protein 5A n=1 Tax=Orchesella dallaii TaxID=48710 RepID=A0ABP1S4R6_9HEXA